MAVIFLNNRGPDFEPCRKLDSIFMTSEYKSHAQLRRAYLFRQISVDREMGKESESAKIRETMEVKMEVKHVTHIFAHVLIYLEKEIGTSWPSTAYTAVIDFP